MRFVIAFFILFSTFFSVFSRTTECHYVCNRLADSLVLVKLYENTNGQSWVTPWNLSGPMNTWGGVALDANGCVTGLSLSNNNLNGTLPAEIGNLSELRNLYLFGNRISGIIPDGIGQLILLENLILDDNLIDGPLPNSLGDLTLLRVFSIGGNMLDGNFPAMILNNTNLIQLNLSNNLFSGNLPFALSRLSQLNLFDISDNRFEGSLPNSISNLVALRELYIHDNKMSGELPSSMSALNQLRHFWAFNNNFSGLVPDLRSAQLISLRIEDNSFEEIPDYSSVTTWGSSEPFGLIIHGNKFTFEDLIPLQKIPRRFYFKFDPQDPITVDTIIYIAKGSNYTIRLFIDPQITDNNYKWYKDTTIVFISNANFYEFVNFMESDEGYYSGLVTNSLIPDFHLIIPRIRVVMSEPERCDNPLSGTNCRNALEFCSTTALHNYCGNLSIPDTSYSGIFLCDSTGELDSPKWISFNASADSTVFEVFPIDCEPVFHQGEEKKGLQVAIWSDCDGSPGEKLYCQSECMNDPFLIGGDGFIVGERYFILIDGCFGSLCGYHIQVRSGRSQFSLTEPEPIQGDQAFCPDSLDHIFSVATIPGATTYQWYLNDTLIKTSPDTFINLQDRSSGIYELRLRAFNSCDTTASIFIIFQIFQKLEMTTPHIVRYGRDSVFTVGFSISGGNPPYKIIKGSGILDSLGGSFISNLILCNSPYDIQIADKWDCPIGIIGFESCGCFSKAGNMPNDTLMICESQNFSLQNLNNFMIDSGDVSAYFLYTNPNDPGGSVVKISSNGFFIYDPSFRFNVVYYAAFGISRPNNQGNINFKHPCLSISNPQIIIFRPKPIVSAGPDKTFCGLEGTLNGFGNYITADWRFVSGPGLVIIDSIQNDFTKVRVETLGVYTFARDGRSQHCLHKDEVKITFKENIVPIITGNLFVCENQNTLLDAGPGYIKHVWSNGDSGRTARFFTIGTHCVTVTDRNLCVGTACVNVDIASPPTFNMIAPDTICTGRFDVISLDKPFIQYSWNQGSSTPNISIDKGGEYCVTVTDESGCTASNCITVFGLPRSQFEIIDSSCQNESFIFLNKSYLTPGIYNINIDGGNSQGCDSIVQLTLLAFPAVLLVDSLIQNDQGNGNGSISITAKGGRMPYTYLWNNGRTSSSISNLRAGEYTLRITDANQCQYIFRFKVLLGTGTQINYTIDIPFYIFPNPKKEHQNLIIKMLEDCSDCTIQILNTTGIVLYNNYQSLFTAKQEIIVDTFLLQGMYYIKFKDNFGRTFIKKLIIVN
ncbi:MAG: T9SS type A sorting domain-containing protein [Bacteroidota bacterium]|nr:T9SS type A sorting domain-containing protein [Bacteroidota bacterium]